MPKLASFRFIFYSNNPFPAKDLLSNAFFPICNITKKRNCQSVLGLSPIYDPYRFWLPCTNCQKPYFELILSVELYLSSPFLIFLNLVASNLVLFLLFGGGHPEMVFVRIKF